MKRLNALLLGVLLAGCDEATVITHVDKLSHMSLSDLVTMQDGGGIPVEFHGLPFRTASPETLASAMRAPAAASQGIRFRPIVPGHGGGHGWRLVLHFNPTGAPNGFADCKHTSEQTTNPPKAEGFDVNATFCEGSDWQAHGFMKSLKTADGDLEGYRDVMQQLMAAIFRENSDKDR